MATKTQSRNGSSSNASGSVFNWNKANAGVLVGAAVAGAAVGLVANVGRKLFVQMSSGAAGDWDETLKTEHQMTRALFDKIEATEDSQAMLRSHLLAKLKYALSKHAIEEEMVVYPALREADETAAADHLTSDHGYVKTYLYELEIEPNDTPSWMAKVRDFRTMIEDHMREEEAEIFPRLRSRLSDAENAKVSAMMHKEGFKFA